MKKIPFIFIVFIFIVHNHQLQAQTLDKKFASIGINTNGKVSAIVQKDNIAYIGGDFTQVGIGKKSLVRFNHGTDKPAQNFPELGGNDYVNAMEPDGSDGFYLAGYFNSFNGISISETNIIHVLSGGVLDKDFGAVNIGEYWLNILALKKVSNRLYVGGSFQTIQNTGRPYLAAVNATTGKLQNWVPETPANWVLQIDANDSWLFINVSVEIFGRHVPYFCYALNASNGKTSSNFPESDSITCIKIDGSILYMGGNFKQIGTKNIDKFAAINISNNSFNVKSWHPVTSNYLVSDWTDNTINCFYRYKNSIFVGGNFTYDDGNSYSKNIIAFDTSTGDVTYNFNGQYPVYGASGDGDVEGVTSNNDTLVIMGNFQSIYNAGNFIDTRNYIAAYKLTASNAALTTDKFNLNNLPRGLFTDASGNLIVAGDFDLVNFMSRESIAAINLNTGLPTSFSPNPYVTSGGDGYVNALTIKDSILFAGGYFTNIGNAQRANLAAINIYNGDPIYSWVANTDNEVKSLAIKDSVLYVGGNFSKVKNKTRHFAAALLTDTAVVLAWDPNLNDVVNTILPVDNNVYLGGNFTKVNQTTNKKYLAKFDNINGNLEASPPVPNGIVYSLFALSDTVYAGGNFTKIGDSTRHSLASFISTTNAVTGFNVKLTGSDVAVNALANWGSTLFVGSNNLSKVNGASRGNLASVDITTGTATAFNPKPGNAVTCVYVGANKLFAGGPWNNVGTNPSPSGLAVFTLEPQTQASDISFTKLKTKSVKISFTTGSGENRLVVIKQDSIPVSPEDGKGYTANNVFGKGEKTGTNSFVVYSGNGDEVSVTGLLPNHSYYVSVYEFNGNGIGCDYLTTTFVTDSFTTPCPSYNSLQISNSDSLNFCSGDSVILSAPAGFTQYLWSNNKKSKKITVKNSGVYFVTVTDSNGCQGTTSSDTVTVMPIIGSIGIIKGQKGNLCGGATNVKYSIDAVENATSYTWKVPGNCTLVSGQNSLSIKINVPSDFTAGNVIVKAKNNCGSVSDTLRIMAKPAATSAIKGPKTVSANETGLVYSVTNVEGLNYSWSVPDDAVITSGAGTNTITVTWGLVAGQVIVYAENSCGVSPTKKLSVKLGAAVASQNGIEDVITDALAKKPEVYPNPTRDKSTVVFYAGAPAKYFIQLSDANGKILMQKETFANAGGNSISIDTKNLAAGIYLVSIADERDNRQHLKLVKQ
ncbi:MAG: T9SS type A sorting domain-containing protein [Bacteroidetes bacterium]|nr:T9SS type A sorting domain-containing protein [Bacteroidota bacterium]